MSKQNEDKWQTLFAEQERSGLSVVAFCKQRDIIPQTFYSQRYKRKKRGSLSRCVEATEFISVNTMSCYAEPQEQITVQCGEVSMHFPVTFDVSQLTALVKGLR